MALATSTEYCFPREYFKLVNRFLKEVGLYPFFWLKFLYFNPLNDATDKFKKRHTNWNLKHTTYTIVDVLGRTNFSDFLAEFYGKRLPKDTYTFELLAKFLYDLYPHLLKTSNDFAAAKDGAKSLLVDKEKKKVSIILNKKHEIL